MSYFVFLLAISYGSFNYTNMARPILRSHNISLAELDAYAENILISMRANVTIFPDPRPDLDVFESVLKEFRVSMVEASFRDKRAVIRCQKLKQQLKNMIRDLSYYVAYVAQGEESIIVDAGFIASKNPAPIGEAPIPHNLRVWNMGVGSHAVKARVDRWPQAKVYRFEYRLKDTESEWKSVFSSKSNCIVDHMEQFKEYEFRVAYITTNPNLNYSAVISCLVV